MADGRSSFGQLYDQYPVTPYPVINAEPTFGAVFRGMTLGDHVQTVVGTAIGATMGFAGGKPIRRQSFFYGGFVIGGIAFVAGARQSFLRLTGQRPNPRECDRAGIPFTSSGPW